MNTSTDGLRAGDEERSGEDSECHASEASVRSAPSRLFVDVRNLSEFAAAAYPKPDFTAAIAGIGNLSKLTADAYPKPDFTAAIAGIGNLSKLTAAAYPKPDFTAAIAGIGNLNLGTGVRMARAIGLIGLAAQVQASRVRGQVAGFDEAARTLIDDLGWSEGLNDNAVAFAPTTDDTAYDAMAEVAPEVAMAVDEAASKVRTPFWNRRAVRNSLAWMLVTIVIAVFAAGVSLPPPWSSILNGLLGVSGISWSHRLQTGVQAGRTQRCRAAGVRHGPRHHPTSGQGSSDADAPRTQRRASDQAPGWPRRTGPSLHSHRLAQQAWRHRD